jgi:hypothetical protein
MLAALHRQAENKLSQGIELIDWQINANVFILPWNQPLLVMIAFGSTVVSHSNACKKETDFECKSPGAHTSLENIKSMLNRTGRLRSHHIGYRVRIRYDTKRYNCTV